MVLDYIESGIQLVSILIALLIALFQYINTNNRGWLYAVIFNIAGLLSSYFWTSNLFIMGDAPNTSDFLSYFGWNVSYLIIVFLVIHMKSKEERKYFHVLMLVPIPLNIWQFTLYLEFGGIINSAYQVLICTVIACLALQSILWRFKNRKNDKRPAYVAISALVVVICEFGMWTSSCYDGWVAYLYYVFSILLSIGYFLMLLMIRKEIKNQPSQTQILIDKKIQRIMKIAFLIIISFASVGGVLLGNWIRKKVSAGVAVQSEEELFEIIPIILFLVSIIIAAFAIAIILIVYFEQKIAENNKLREEKNIANRSNAAKSEFLANMSHEIRTPINAVLGMNEMIYNDSLRLRDDLPDNREKVKESFSQIVAYSGNIDSAGKNLLYLINDILDFSKIEAGKLELVEGEYRLSDVLNNVCSMVTFKLREKNLAFYAEVDETLPDVLYGDEIRVRQVLTNLLNNAAKYTEEGSVSLKVEKSGEHPEDSEKCIFTISIIDTGIGIKKEDMEKLFGKFERMDMKKNSNIEGTGLGLAITRRLIEMMGGSVEVESEYGEGSTFTIHLPQKVVSNEPVGNFREKFKKSMQEATAVEATFEAPDAKVLVVDDTPVNLTVAKGLLKSTAIVPDTADSGKIALDFTKEKQYDIIFMDQRMPEMDGIETLTFIRNQKDGLNVETPVICLTADAVSGAKERYTEEGFDDYLSKPIDSSLLKDMIRSYIPADKIILK